ALAILGATTQTLSPQELHEALLQLRSLDCKALVLCPTSEQALYHETLSDELCQLQAKPACTRKLQRGLSMLLGNDVLYSRPHRTSSQRSPRLLCVDDNAANLLLVKTLLTDMQAQVDAVDSGYAALEAF